ncbi:DUF3889 domain-containing protein [Solibacillus sp. FSL K6-1523]|uniref:DUF3889 domain-containing protein n=1 Tax=Solibacillus sp. FSL K6-1523 TaxID=2921471 RepID=UPI0030FC2E1A
MMRKLIVALSVFSAVLSIPPHASTIVHAQKETPAYAKWGALAMREAQNQYPHAQIIDYLHRGRETREDVIIEKFKFWLKQGDKEFGVYVNIIFVATTEKIVTIEFQETDR